MSSPGRPTSPSSPRSSSARPGTPPSPERGDPRPGVERADGYRPRDLEVESLIRQAEEHPLGTDFLRKGALDSVASTFGVHAFVIDQAREALRNAEPRPGGSA